MATSEEGSEVIRMAGMAICSVNGITRAFGPACGALAVRVLAGEVPALGALTH